MDKNFKNVSINDYNYDLDQGHIAVFPQSVRDRSRLLVYRDEKIEDDHFFNIADYLPEGASLYLNDTRVIEARLLFQKPTGGVIELFCLEPYHLPVEISLNLCGRARWLCLIGGASKWKYGQVLEKKISINNEEVVFQAHYIQKLKDSFIIEFSWLPENIPFSAILHASGSIPLPPYLKREATREDMERYQTIFAHHEGSVAAPTAALHFTDETFVKLKGKGIMPFYITLHVGAGTFKPVKSETIADHEMHSEPFTITKEALERLISSKKVIAVGTTTLRTIESIYWLGIKLINGLIAEDWTLNQWECYDLEDNYPETDPKKSIEAIINWLNEHSQNEVHCHTSLIIVPGYKFQIADALVTNFHQPQSTLLLLVSAFVGKNWKKIYEHALENNYRFLSYGDSSLLFRNR